MPAQAVKGEAGGEGKEQLRGGKQHPRSAEAEDSGRVASPAEGGKGEDQGGPDGGGAPSGDQGKDNQQEQDQQQPRESGQEAEDTGEEQGQQSDVEAGDGETVGQACFPEDIHLFFWGIPERSAQEEGVQERAKIFSRSS